MQSATSVTTLPALWLLCDVGDWTDSRWLWLAGVQRRLVDKPVGTSSVNLSVSVYLQRADASAASFPHCTACVSAWVLAVLSAATPPWASCELAATLCSICLRKMV